MTRTIVYNVKFSPGRYKISLSPTGNGWIIGREDDGTITGMAITQNDAMHICLALNLADAYVTGKKDKEILQALERLKTQH